jgi:hypothetical protein
MKNSPICTVTFIHAMHLKLKRDRTDKKRKWDFPKYKES